MSSDGANNIKVAVRVRPFNGRERERKARLCISMNGNSTEIKDCNAPNEEPKKFAFDHSYWSHDSFVEGEEGYLSPDGAASPYADQEKVFSDVGSGILDNSWAGYNSTLFAYGQTGSGKSYSIVGYGKNRGVVPIFCERLFKGIAEKKPNLGENEDLKVKFSMLEIYSEQVRDLLNPKANKGGGLKVRQHPGKGFYVLNLSEVPVGSYSEIDSKMSEGTKNRTIAATNMNATSSRAHTIVALTFTQKTSETGTSMTRTAVVNLVDLAGSERAESTGATGDRLKEGAAINQSLSSLGNVIKALVDQANGRKVVVPFRDSVLTKLLKNALGGNSKTILIAALSPADINYEETLSTLRFADRAKSVKTSAIINESPTEKLIRELREENEKLKAALLQGGMPQEKETPDNSEEMEKIVQEKKMEMEEAIKRNYEEMQKIHQNWEERLKQEQEKTAALVAEREEVEKRKKLDPYMWNLAEDPAMTGMVFHFLEPGKKRVGNSKADPQPDIVLNGLSVQPDHLSFDCDAAREHVRLTPKPGAAVKVNGADVKVETELRHNDRILIGSNHLYVLHHPKSYQKILDDIAKAAEEADLERQRQQQQQEGEAIPVAAAPPSSQQQQLETPTYESAQQEIVEASGLLSGALHTEDEKLLHEDLLQTVPWVNEVNAISEELRKPMKFSVVLVAPQAKGLKSGRTEVSVKMTDATTGNDWIWNRNKFINRKSLMKEMWSKFADGLDWELPQDNCPFWEPPDAMVTIGSVHVLLQSIAYLIDMDENLAITNFKGNEKGNLNVKAFPVDEKGEIFIDDDHEDPYALVGKALRFKLQIKAARDLPTKYKKTCCRYKFFLDQDFDETLEVEHTSNPDYDHERTIVVDPVTKPFVDYLLKTPLIVEVMGSQTKTTTEGAATAGSKMISNAVIERTEEKMKYYQTKEEEVLKMIGDLRSSVEQRRAAGEGTMSCDDVDAILKSVIGVGDGAPGVNGPTKSAMCLLQ